MPRKSKRKTKPATPYLGVSKSGRLYNRKTGRFVKQGTPYRKQYARKHKATERRQLHSLELSAKKSVSARRAKLQENKRLERRQAYAPLNTSEGDAKLNAITERTLATLGEKSPQSRRWLKEGKTKVYKSLKGKPSHTGKKFRFDPSKFTEKTLRDFLASRAGKKVSVRFRVQVNGVHWRATNALHCDPENAGDFFTRIGDFVNGYEYEGEDVADSIDVIEAELFESVH